MASFEVNDATTQQTVSDFYVQARAVGYREGRRDGFAEGWRAAVDALFEAIPEALHNLKPPSSGFNSDNPSMPLDSPIEHLELGVRAYHCLKRLEFNSIRELVDQTEEDFRRLPNLGRQTCDEVVRTLAEFGYQFLPSDTK